MKRAATGELSAWLARRGRKPLVIRGARQVGKSYLVRDFATTRGLDLVELNFERDPKTAKLRRLREVRERGASRSADQGARCGAANDRKEVYLQSSGSRRARGRAAPGRRSAVRFHAGLPSVTPVSTLTTGGDRASYELISLPLYLAGNVVRILHEREPRPRKR